PTSVVYAARPNCRSGRSAAEIRATLAELAVSSNATHGSFLPVREAAPRRGYLPAEKPWQRLRDLVRGCATHYPFVPKVAGRPPAALPRWRQPILAAWSSDLAVRRLSYRMIVRMCPDSWSTFENWLVQKRTNGTQSRAFPCISGFSRVVLSVRCVGVRSRSSGQTAGHKCWRVGKKRKKNFGIFRIS